MSYGVHATGPYSMSLPKSRFVIRPWWRASSESCFIWYGSPMSAVGFLRDVVSHFGPAALIVLEAAPKYQRLASPAVSFFLLVSNNRFCWQANA